MKKMAIILIIVLGIAFLVMPGSAQTEGCDEYSISSACGCTACAESLNLQVTPTCDGVQLTWNDIGADDYFVAYYNPNTNEWVGFGFTGGTSYTISNVDLPPETYSFVIITWDFESEWFECYSNIVCDVEFPATCPNIPEFPSLLLPATMIIGFLGAVLLIQRTREQ